MKILVCNERFLFRFGVDRVLLMLGAEWRKAGHEVILMGCRMDEASVSKCSDWFIRIPEAPDYILGNEFTLSYLEQHWDDWFDEDSCPDVAFVAGWPFYLSFSFLREKCGCLIYHDHGAVPTRGRMSGPNLKVQKMLQKMRRGNLKNANRIVAVSRFLRDTQSRPDVKGRVTTTYVHNAVDHITGALWESGELNLGENRVLSEIRDLQAKGVRILFQPGRWETGNYKNSDGSVEIVKALRDAGIDHRILLLAGEKDAQEIPAEVRDNYLCLGFIDDATMKQVMELSDVGIMPSTWEGFDLPLGEMQYLGTPMFVLDIGAHPEVVVDSWFLCKDMREMAEKIILQLKGKAPLTEEKFGKLCEDFRKEFTWAHRAEQMLSEIRVALRDAYVLFIDVTNACRDRANAGVMRVTRKLSRKLQERLNTVFVIWDEETGEFVLPTEAELAVLGSFEGPAAKKVLYRSLSGLPRRRLAELLPEFGAAPKGMLFIETAAYGMMESAVPWLHRRGIAVSAVFHDAIPVLHPDFCNSEVVANHQRYMDNLADIDLVMPTAEHNGKDLADDWEKRGITSRAKVEAVGLAAELDGVSRNRTKLLNAPEKKQVLFVSTLEPRKNHIRFLRAFESVMAQHPELEKNVTLHLVGKKYEQNEEIPAFVEDFCEAHEYAEYLGVVDDKTLKAEYAACTFTAYPSLFEGFGMPIIESLWAGKPCLCNDRGSIGDLAKAGGCCVVDTGSQSAMADALYKMLTDSGYLLELQLQATEREIRSWDEYADEAAEKLCGIGRVVGDRDHVMPTGIQKAVESVFESFNGRRMITVSQQYPPQVIGGAEIIAHLQLKTMQEDGLCRSVVLSLDVQGKHIPETVTCETYEGVNVVRICFPIERLDQRGICFFHPLVNEVFREMCGIVQPEVVHGHHITGLSLGIIDIAKEFGAKTVFTVHDNWGFCFKGTTIGNNGKLCPNAVDCEDCRKVFDFDEYRIPMGSRKSYYRRQMEKTDAFVSPSEFMAKAYIRAGFDPRKIHVIWNGIDSEKYARVKAEPAGKIRITFAGIFGPHKGVEYLIRALGQLKEEPILLNLVGRGDEEPKYRELAEMLGVTEKISFRGKVDNNRMIDIYRETDIFCLPAVSPENQPVTITEAMACGIPVIASRIGGVPELVEDGVTGYLAEPRNAEDLAEKIRMMIADRERMREMGEAGRQRMRDNDFHRQAKKLAELYDSVRPAEVKTRAFITVEGKEIPYGMDKEHPEDVLLEEWMRP